jgi:hypothetical protein
MSEIVDDEQPECVIEQSRNPPGVRRLRLMLRTHQQPHTDRGLIVFDDDSLHDWARPEDWSVQPTVYAGFHWMTDGFFDGFFDKKPTMDMPRR